MATFPISKLCTRADRLYALPDVHASDALQIMTIHKAKGLEFDTVIVPGLGRRPAQQETRLLMWLERPRGHDGDDLLLAPVKESGADADSIYSCVTRLDKEKESHEDGRLLYVAATRARTRLHLLGSVQAKADDGGRQPARPASGSCSSSSGPR